MAAITAGATNGNEYEATKSLEAAGLSNPSSGLVRYVAYGDMGFSPGDASRLASIGALPAGAAAGGAGGDYGLQKILDEYKRQQEERNKVVEQYKTANPWIYDEVLAEKMGQAKEQLDPWYNQTLSDYLQGVKTQKERTVEDERRLLGELQTDVQQYTSEAKNNLQLALDKAAEGATQTGLYQSGIAKRQQGLIQRESSTELANYLKGAGRRKQEISLTAGRTLEDIQRQEAYQTRDIERERQAQTKLLAEQMAQEAGTKWAYGLQQALAPYQDYTTGDILTGLGIT